jgi:metallophosphoesterase (TIGR03767 family)
VGHSDRSLTRRRFLQAVAAVAAATRLPFEVVEAAMAADPTGTTLDRTIVRLLSSGYATLGYGPGEPHEPHPDNPVARDPASPRRALVAFAQLTDIHLVDAQSPLRVEWIDRFESCLHLGVGGSQRPQEAMTTQVLSAMVRALNDVQMRRVAAGEPPLAFAVSTGDNTDNQHLNELHWFIDGLDGAATLTPNSGGPAYEGVQSPDWGDPHYWLPRADVADGYKAGGFPGEDAWGYGPDGLLAAAIAPFATPALAMPWYSAYGNHDGLIQGNFPRNDQMQAIAQGDQKTTGPPPAVDPCDTGNLIRALQDPGAIFQGPTKPVTADAARRVVDRREYIEAHLGHGHPGGFGHGFTAGHAAAATAYYTIDTVPGFRFVVLDTVNPGGYAEGSIGATQFQWLGQQIAAAADRYVILFSHHGLHSLSNPFAGPDPFHPEPERRVLGDEVEAMLHGFPNVIAWIAGHTHENRITRRTGANGHVFWDVETAAHIDWSCQSRIVEVLDDGDVLTIRVTLVDHAAPARRADLAASGLDPTLRLAGIHRELAANDPQFDQATGLGPRAARNVELTVAKPVLGGAGVTTTTAAPSSTTPPTLPRTGRDDEPFTLVGAALAAAGAAALGLARRRTEVAASPGAGGDQR